VLGVGLVQNFNNAATEWYLGYRNYALDLNSGATCTAVTVAGATTTTAATFTNAPNCKIEDMNLIVTGLRIKF
jgi:hypothetical protein